MPAQTPAYDTSHWNDDTPTPGGESGYTGTPDVRHTGTPDLRGGSSALAISASLFLIVSTSVVLGTLLPLLLQAAKLDAANASTTIQVIMDVLGVLITCTVAPQTCRKGGGFQIQADSQAPS